MSNQLLFFLTTLVLVAVLVLFGLNMKSLTNTQTAYETYLKYNEVRGIAIEKEGKLHTLNFNQQNRMIQILNGATPTSPQSKGERTPVNFQKIVIYQFKNKPDLIISPINYVDNNLVFNQTEWSSTGSLSEHSGGELKQTIEQGVSEK